MNTFITKRQLAKIYYDEELDIAILAKLLVLQKLDNDLFIQLNEWNKEFDTENVKFKEMRLAVTQGTAIGQDPWAAPQIKKWLECKPVELEKYPLEKYFYLTRENLKNSNVDESGFSSNTKNILARIGKAQSGQMKAIINDAKVLLPEEIADVFKVIIPKIEKGDLKFFIIRDMFTNFERFRGKISEALTKSNRKIKVGDIPALRTMYQNDPDCLELSLQRMVEKETLSKEMLSDIKMEQKEG